MNSKRLYFLRTQYISDINPDCPLWFLTKYNCSLYSSIFLDNKEWLVVHSFWRNISFRCSIYPIIDWHMYYSYYITFLRCFQFDESFSIALPVTLSRAPLGKEMVVKQLQSNGKWRDLQSADVTFDDYKVCRNVLHWNITKSNITITILIYGQTKWNTLVIVSA